MEVINERGRSNGDLTYKGEIDRQTDRERSFRSRENAQFIAGPPNVVIVIDNKNICRDVNTYVNHSILVPINNHG